MSISAFIKKEFLHVLRDKWTLLILFGLPMVQIMLFGFALSNEVKNIGITILDQSKSTESEHIIKRIENSEYFIFQSYAQGYADINNSFLNGSSKCALVFPQSFATDLQSSGVGNIQIITDGSDPNTGRIVQQYIAQIVQTYVGELNTTLPMTIVPKIKHLYNEEQNGSLNFVPGVIALIFMIVCTALTSVSVVREKEQGTMEILLVSPFKPILLLLAKALPYLFLSFINLAIILTLSSFVLHVPIRGSLLAILGISLLFIVTCLSLGLLISNLTNSQQTAMLISMMGMMLPTIILTGFLFPLENMPKFFQIISHAIPSRYYYEIIKTVMLKGLPLSYVWKDVLILFGMTAGLLVLAMKKFNARL